MKRNVVIACACMALVAGLAFADESKLTIRARTKLNLATVYLDDAGENSGVSVPGDDRFGVEYKGEKAGAVILLKGKLIDGTVELYDYYGWMSFGDLKLTAGEWDHRKADIVDKDASNWGGLWDLYYGPLKVDASKEGGINFSSESDNITPWKSEFSGDYGFGNASFAFASGSNSKDPYNVMEQFGARGTYAIGETAKLTGTFVMNGKEKATVGIFANLLMVENLNAVIGYSGYHDLDVSENSLNAVELRARYAMGDLSLTTHNNVTLGDDLMILYNMANVAWKMNDTVTPCLLVANSNVTGDAAELAGTAGNLLTVRPGVTLTAQKGAAIDAGVRFEMSSPEAGDSVTKITVPVIFRVKF